MSQSGVCDVRKFFGTDHKTKHQPPPPASPPSCSPPPPSTPPTLTLAARPITETGPFARLAGTLDAGARRVLPAHLLRRCRVTSSLPLGPAAAAVRTDVVGVTGEESVIAWRLTRRQPPEGGWAVAAATRDGGGDADAGAAARAPHPRLSPEAVVAAIVAALGRSDMASAARFVAVPPGAPRAAAAAAPALEAAVSVCQAHTVAGSATPTPRAAWVETVAPGDAAGSRLLWRLCVGGGGGWRVRGVERW